TPIATTFPYTPLLRSRRLVEAEKTSSLLVSRRVAVKVLPLVGGVPHHLDRWSPWEHFDFQSTSRAEIDVVSLYHEFIHSFIFMRSEEHTSELQSRENL